MRKLFTFIVLGALSHGLFAQKPILLNNANLELPNNVESHQAGENEAYNGLIVRVLQFDQIPTEATIRKMEAAGITLLDYIPHNAYQASIPVTVTGSMLKRWGVRSSIIPNREFKLSNNLYNGIIPEHADQGNERVEIVIIPFAHVPAQHLAASIHIDHFDVIQVIDQGNFIEAICKIADLGQLVNHPLISNILEAEVPGEKENNTAITSHRINYINGTHAPGYSYTGEGVKVSLGDDGEIGPHIDYKGRLDQSNAGASNGDHGDHVAGTIFGAGNRDPRGRGMAPGAEMLYYSYPANLNNTTADYNNEGIRITSSSYSNGCNAGYTNFARTMDQTSRQLNGLMHVFSAGNSGTSNCGYGAGTGWGNITGGHKVGKNVIAVGNLTRLDNIANSSSRGPAHDGRIKPEVCGVGTQVFSTTFPHEYTTKTGTSMSCPGVSGSLAVLYEAYEDLTSNAPHGGLMKALLMNGAQDLGNPGPDYIYGFGRINMRKSLRMVENNWIISGSVSQNNNNNHTITVPAGVTQMRVMVYWTDREANVNAAKALVNDLDMVVTQGANTYQPFVLNPTPVPALLNAAATTGVDTLNNVEQVVVNNPSAGNYTVNINGTAVPFGPQNYHIVYYFENELLELTYPVGGESFVPGNQEIIRWDAPPATGNFTLQYSANNGSTWTNIATVGQNSRHYTWTVPVLMNGQIKVRISRGSEVSESDSLTIAQVPQNLAFSQICPDTTTLQWSPVSNAGGYVVYKLGNKYMDSVGFTTGTSFMVGNVSAFDDHWYSVAAVAPNGGIGRRALAIQSGGNGYFNCIVYKDLEAAHLVSPQNGLYPNCATDSIEVALWVKNNGIDTATNFSINFRINGGAVTSQNFNQVIVSGDSALIQMNSYIQPLSTTVNNIKVWVSMQNDQSFRNDTAYAMIETYGSGSQTLPFVMDFENESTCPTTSNCEGTVCPLGNGYINAENGVFDDIDWRVNSGGTPSNNTGPMVDNTLGTASGKYVYLEATVCFEKTSYLYTPCVDLSNASAPILEFYHHRRGNSLGDLNVEVFYQGQWHQLMPTIVANTGNVWTRYEANLVPYLGETIAVRFRGETNTSWQGDIALDDIVFKESTDIPVADFVAIDSIACPAVEVKLEDLSSGTPNTWNWSISPGTYTLAPGSSLTDREPRVIFNALGNYSVTLAASNNNGGDTLTKTNHITITDGLALPYLGVYSNSTGAVLPGWAIENPDNSDTWELVPNLPNPSSNAAVRVNNHGYNAPGERDHLISPIFDLSNQTRAYLIFDYAYTPYNSNFTDSLQVDIAVGCEGDFDDVLFYDGGTALSTTGNFSTALFVPNMNQWSSDTIDLSTYIDNSVRFRFTNINGYGNVMYLNNFRIVDTLMDAPNVSIAANVAEGCVNDTVIFSQTSTNGTQFNWNFGNAATPSTATGPGPHAVVYGSTGNKNISVTATNAGGQSADVISLNVENAPFAAFNQVINNLEVTFTDVSIGGATAWHWDFGDGNSSTAQNPVHNYAASGTYTVVQTATNDCGDRTFTRDLTVENIGVASFNSLPSWKLFPNPGQGTFTVEIPEEVNAYRMQIIDLEGQILMEEVFVESPISREVNMEKYASGSYIVRLYHQYGVKSLRYTLMK